jgi:hypothetical protein
MTNSSEPSSANHAQANREKIRDSLNEITAELNSALAAAGLACPVYMCIPTGNALLTFACPLDPDDNEWARITEIALEIVGKRIGKTQLQTRELACAMAGATMGAAELIMA